MFVETSEQMSGCSSCIALFHQAIVDDFVSFSFIFNSFVDIVDHVLPVNGTIFMLPIPRFGNTKSEMIHIFRCWFSSFGIDVFLQQVLVHVDIRFIQAFLGGLLQFRSYLLN